MEAFLDGHVSAFAFLGENPPSQASSRSHTVSAIRSALSLCLPGRPASQANVSSPSIRSTELLGVDATPNRAECRSYALRGHRTSR